MKIKISELEKKIRQTLEDSQFEDNKVKKIIDYLLWAEAWGIQTQWIIKMTWTDSLQDIKAKHELQIERDTPVSQLINAWAQPSIYASWVATDVVIEKAKNSWMAIVSVRNTFSSNWAQAFYSEKIAKNDLIWIVVSRSPWSVAPFNSIDPLLGTNPIGFSFPTMDTPCTFDIATSAITFYGLILADSKWEKIGDNLAIDKAGTITNNPVEAMDWAILPFDRSYKWSALSMMVELLSWPLVSAWFCDYKTYDLEWGSTFIAIDPNILVDSEEFKKNSSKMLNIIRGSRSNDNSAIRIPWEKSSKLREEAFSTWYVDVEEATLKELKYL